MLYFTQLCVTINLGLKKPGYADVAEWQTHQTQNLTRVTSCGFKSHLLHTKNPEISGFFIFMLHFVLHPVLILIIKCYSTACSHNNVYPGLHNLILTIPLDSRIKFRIHNIEVLRIQMFLCDS